MADKKSTVALCLPRALHLRRFSSQAAPGTNLGDSPPRVLELRARLERHIEPGFAPGMVASSPADPLAPPGRYPIQKAIADLSIFGPPDRVLPVEGDAECRGSAACRSLRSPGEDWLYGTGSNIQGVLVARASSQSLSRFLRRANLFGRWG
jgi:hypothetical protein